MTSAAETVTEIRSAGRNRQLVISAWRTDRVHAAAVFRDGREIDTSIIRSPLLRLLARSGDGRLRALSGTTTLRPTDLVRLLEHLPTWAAPDTVEQAPGDPHLRADSPPVMSEAPVALATSARSLSQAPAGTTVEARVQHVAESVTVAGQEQAAGYTTARYVIQLRVSSTTPSRASRTTSLHGPDLQQLVDRALDRRGALIEDVGLPVARTVPARDATIVLAGEVAGQLLALAAKSFSAEAVLAGRSRLGPNLLGSELLSPSIDLRDDAALPGAPLRAPFDDEGTPCSPLALVSGGTLAAFLGGVVTASLPGNAAGHCWSSDRLSPARPSGSNLTLTRAAAAGTRKRGTGLTVIECQGLHMANDITGDFAMAATLLVTGGRRVERLDQVMLAGNVFEVLARAEPLASGVEWFAGSSTFYGCPELEVTGLQVNQ